MVKPLSTSLQGRQHCAEVRRQEAKKAGWSEEAALNGVDEERDGMSDEEGNEIDGD